MTAEQWAPRILAGYVAAAVLCFGPAVVQSERAEAAHDAACLAEYPNDPRLRALCRLGGPSIADGAAKAIFWPLWVSYTIARGF